MLGDAIAVDSLVQLPLRELTISEGSITGCVQYIDRFGNLITNLPAVAVRGQNWSVQVRETVIPAGETYSEVDQGEVVALIGSHGWLEIAVNQGSAQSQLGVDLGEKVRIMNYE
jgi:S-adenosylmethionine hydrolase